MNKNQLLKIYKTFHLIKFSQEYLMSIYHPEDLMRCPIHFCLGHNFIISYINKQIYSEKKLSIKITHEFKI